MQDFFLYEAYMYHLLSGSWASKPFDDYLSDKDLVNKKRQSRKLIPLDCLVHLFKIENMNQNMFSFSHLLLRQ